jgi:16S rRNA (guanine1516-N2)-methyltransferase
MPPSWERPEVTLVAPVRGSDAALAAGFGIRVAPSRDPSSWQLVRSPHRMELWSPDGRDAVHIDLDVANGPLARRLRGARAGDPLPRACGLHRRAAPPVVVDATGGLCRDAMVLAHLGCTVVAVERVPALAFLAQHAIGASWLAGRMRVELGDSIAFLRALPDDARPDVVTIDPMYEPGGRAQVKKEMQVCRALAGPPTDDAELLRVALATANERVVVKRDRGAPPLAPGVSFAVDGERVRFDVYLSARGDDAPR